MKRIRSKTKSELVVEDPNAFGPDWMPTFDKSYEVVDLDEGAHFTSLRALFVTLFMITKASQKVVYSS